MGREWKVQVLVYFKGGRMAIMRQWEMQKLIKGKNKNLIDRWDFNCDKVLLGFIRIK